jgi:hypothetical protein
VSEQKILDAMAYAERKAWEALAGYKFYMFGYWAAAWVKYNQLLSTRRPNPFKDAVKLARYKLDESEKLLGWNAVDEGAREHEEASA